MKCWGLPCTAAHEYINLSWPSNSRGFLHTNSRFAIHSRRSFLEVNSFPELWRGHQKSTDNEELLQCCPALSLLVLHMHDSSAWTSTQHFKHGLIDKSTWLLLLTKRPFRESTKTHRKREINSYLLSFRIFFFLISSKTISNVVFLKCKIFEVLVDSNVD